MEEELIQNQMKKKENEELKKQIQSKSEDAEPVALCRDNIKDIWQAIEVGSLYDVKFYHEANLQNIMKEHSVKSTPLHYASKFGHLHIIEFLITKVEIDKTNSNGDTPLIWATEGGHLSVINYLLVKGAELNHQNKNKETALIIAARGNNFDIVKSLIGRNADTKGALHPACKNGCLEIMKYFLPNVDEIDNRDSEGFTPLMRAVEGNKMDAVKLLIGRGADTKGALHPACKNGCLEIMKYLLPNVDDIDERDSEGFTPLMRAVEGNRMDAVKLLIGRGADTKGALHPVYAIFSHNLPGL